jgi:hypothetical protein
MTSNALACRRAAPSWVALATFVLAGLSAAAAAPESPPAAKAVSLAIDYGDGFQKQYASLPWKEGMTVLDALAAARAHPRGITFKHRGSGETALLLQIDDLANERAAGRNWIYRVNGKLADRSFGIYRLQAGDAVLWRFEKYE